MEHVTKNRLFQLTLLALSLAIGLKAEQAEDKETCSNATLHGSYGLHVTGSSFDPVQPLAAIGRFIFDGKRNVTGKLFVNLVSGGYNGGEEVTGTYSVSPDCIVTDNWGSVAHVSVIVDH